MLIADESNLDLVEAIFNVNNWMSLGLKLGLNNAELGAIEIQKFGNVQACRMEMISQWLNTGDASWRALVRALASKLVGKKGLARSIAAEHPLR